jgi:hypothetical protein
LRTVSYKLKKMKTKIFFVAIIFCGLNVYSQKNSRYDFKVQYDMQLNFNGYYNYKANLYFNNTQSLFEYRETPFVEKEINTEEFKNKLEESNQVSFNIRHRDTVQYYMKYNRYDNLICEFTRGFKNNEFYQVTESAPIVIWTITEERKKIDQYECTKATCSFRGRNYIAWLIVELSDMDKDVILTARIVKKEENLIKNDSIRTRIISRSEYQNIRNQEVKKLEEMVNRITSKSERGIKITAKFNGIKSIEMD